MTPTSDAKDAVRGILCMLLSVMIGIVTDSVVKQLTLGYSILMIVWARYTFHMAMMVGVLGRRFPATLKTRRPGLQAFRSIAQMTAVVTFVGALSLLPLAQCIAIQFLTPILITALSVPVLGERVGLRRWASVLAGFVGVLIIIRPGAGGLSWAALLPLSAALCSAVYQLTTRLVGRTDTPMTSLTYAALAGTALANVLVPFAWITPDATGWVLMGLLGLLGATSHYAQIRAYGFAAAAVVAPYIYTSLLWAVAFGFLFFGEIPDRWTIAGALVIAASGLYIFHRERVAARTREVGG
ncbi:MAG: DMT family transporter [Rhodospirillales bacterium]|nr:DMT family transporter [Rhodospirillales bacterium]